MARVVPIEAEQALLGLPLALLLSRPRALSASLRLSIALAEAVQRLHGRGIIHKDIKPDNIFWREELSQVCITGLGMASLVGRERIEPQPAEMVAGTLAYMAPEQIGRMNRAIDARSDLYSLGVVLYQVFTGRLPFAAVDALEWIHCHIARAPAPIDNQVPSQLEAIVRKLLAKAADDRYQTASGLASDLRRCESQWASLACIERFPLGLDDMSDRFLLPEKLYGRHSQVTVLLDAFARVATQGTSELVLVSGDAGTGKSSVIHELDRVLPPASAMFASGKFDQYQRDIPYATVGQAFQSLVRQVLSKTEREVSSCKERLSEALGNNGELMLKLIPELELIIGPQPPVARLAAQDEQARFQRVFGRFLGVFAQPNQPLALFFDDLQWLDAATLELFAYLVAQPDLRHLLLVGAYRDQELGPSHSLLAKLQALRQAGIRVSEIALSPLGIDDIARLVSDALYCAPERVRPLVELVHSKTGGNPFFVVQFMTLLADERLVTYDPQQKAWSWDVERIRAQNFTDNVVDLMLEKVVRLPEATRQVLRHLACLGNDCPLRSLALVRGVSEELLHEALREAVFAGLVIRQEDSYRFLHDRIQEAAYQLIPGLERASEHLRIGRLLSQGPLAELDERIFQIVSQLNRGTALIDSRAERERVAELNLVAARRARASTAYASALIYLSSSSALLGEDAWSARYALRFGIEFLRAECEFLTGAWEPAEQRLSLLAECARSHADRAAVACLRISVHTARNQPERAVAVLLEYLASNGVHWSAEPTDAQVRAEYAALWRHLGERPIEALFAAAPLTNPEHQATLEVLITAAPPVLFTAPGLFRLIVGRMTSLSIQHGHSDASCLAYVFAGMVLGPYFEDREAAFRFGQVGFDLCEKAGLDRFRARVLLSFGTLIVPWARHLRTGLSMVRTALRVADETGDLEYASYGTLLLSHLLSMGEPLAELQREGEQAQERVRKLGYGTKGVAFEGVLGLVRSLRGDTTRFGHLGRPGLEETQIEAQLAADPAMAMHLCRYWVRKLQARFYAGEYASALRAAARARSLLRAIPSLAESADFQFFSGLAHAANHAAAAVDEREQHLIRLREHRQQLAAWAKDCRENFGSPAQLLEAEAARVEHDDLKAMRLYEDAIDLAREHGFVQQEALACELCAQFYFARGLARVAEVYLRQARACYLRWGALGKVQQLDERYPRLLGPLAAAAGGEMGTLLGKLDVAAVAKASRALSSEIVLGTLSETLMRIAIEHAGAERGLLILRRGEEARIEADASTSAAGVGISLRQRPVSCDELPESVLHYVFRTQEKVSLSDAQLKHEFSADPYFLRHRCRSLLCLPLVKHSHLLGLLYLENNLAPHVFTPTRTAVLELLASQAAISIENAHLYDDLDKSQAQLASRLCFETLRREVSIAVAAVRPEIVDAQIVDALGRVGEFFEADTLCILQPLAASIDVQTTHAWARPDLSESRALAAAAPAAIVHFPLVFDGKVIASLRLESRSHQGPWPEESLQRLRIFGEVFAGALSRAQASVELGRSQAALELAQSELSHVTRVTTMGELAASIAHEINQPLAAIVADASACLNWLATERPDFAVIRESLDAIVRDGERAGQVLTRIRALLARSTVEHGPCDIPEIVHGILPLVESRLSRDGITLQTFLSQGAPSVLGDAVQLQQVLLNLVLNGADASCELDPSRRRIVLRSYVEQRADGRWVVVAVEDAGVGIGAADSLRLFEPFYTTKPTGLGMGLCISRSIIERHGGQLTAIANQGPGVTFRFDLPAAELA